MIGRPTNVGMFFDPGIWAVITKNVPTSPRSFISGRATLNWLIVESSYVMADRGELAVRPLGDFGLRTFLRGDRNDREHAEQKPGVPHGTNSIAAWTTRDGGRGVGGPIGVLLGFFTFSRPPSAVGRTSRQLE